MDDVRDGSFFPAAVPLQLFVHVVAAEEISVAAGAPAIGPASDAVGAIAAEGFLAGGTDLEIVRLHHPLAALARDVRRPIALVFLLGPGPHRHGGIISCYHARPSPGSGRSIVTAV